MQVCHGLRNSSKLWRLEGFSNLRWTKIRQTKESYEHLSASHKARVCAYRADNEIFTDPLLKEALHTCRQEISYCRGVSHNQNTIVEHMIKGLTLCRQTLLIHATRLWTEYVITFLQPFLFKAEFQRYNSLDIDKYRKTPDQKFSVVYFQVSPMDFHTWGCPNFVLKAPLQGGSEGRPKWEPRERPGFYIFRVGVPSIKHHNWEYLPPVPCGILRKILHCGSHEEGHSPRKLEKPGRGVLRYRYT